MTVEKHKKIEIRSEGKPIATVLQGQPRVYGNTMNI